LEELPRPTNRNKYAGAKSSNQKGRDKATEEIPLLQGDLKAELATVIQAAGKSGQLSNAKLDEVLSILGSLSVNASSCWLCDWIAKASVKGRAGLLQLMQRTIDRALDENLTIAEELMASEGSEASETSDFGRLSELCKDALQLEASKRNSVHIAVLVMSQCAEVSGTVPSLDRFVFLFRPSLLAHITSSAKNRLLWMELEEFIGLPPLEKHLCLFSCGAKAVLLNLLLVPEGVPTATVVVNRENALIDAANQLPDGHACIISPFFESSSGTKVVQGRRVEGGEGHGPRKEFFIATSSDTLRRWGDNHMPLPLGFAAAPVQVSFQGNRIRIDRASKSTSVGQSSPEASRAIGQLMQYTVASACNGDRLKLEFSNGTEVEYLILAKQGDSGLYVAGQFDSSICSGTVTLRQCGLQKALKPLFEFHRGTGSYWFSAYASELEHPSHGRDLLLRYFNFGKLLLLSVANRCKISFSLPIVFFELLLNRHKPTSLDDLKGFDDELHSSLKRCLKMGLTEFKALKDVEGLPKEMSREDYVADKVAETFTPKALHEIRRGFWSLTEASYFDYVSASDLWHILCPADNVGKDINIRNIFKVVMDEEMTQCQLFAKAFWAVVDGFSSDEKKLFLRFVTGLEAPPEPGTERLLIELPFSAFSKDEHIAMLDMLPQAHTCSNTLELPNYHDALKESGKVPEENISLLDKELRRLLGEKLRLAIRETAGYELDAVMEVGSSAPPVRSTEIEARDGWTINSEPTREVRSTTPSHTRWAQDAEPARECRSNTPSGLKWVPDSGLAELADPHIKSSTGIKSSMPSSSDDAMINTHHRRGNEGACSSGVYPMPSRPSSAGSSSGSLQSVRSDPATNVNSMPAPRKIHDYVALESVREPVSPAHRRQQMQAREEFPEHRHSVQSLRPHQPLESISPPRSLRQGSQELSQQPRPPLPVSADPGLDMLELASPEPPEPLSQVLPPDTLTPRRPLGSCRSGSLEPLPTRPPVPFVGDFGVGSSEVDGFLEQLRHINSEPFQPTPEKIINSDIDNLDTLIEELDMLDIKSD